MPVVVIRDDMKKLQVVAVDDGERMAATVQTDRDPARRPRSVRGIIVGREQGYIHRNSAKPCQRITCLEPSPAHGTTASILSSRNGSEIRPREGSKPRRGAFPWGTRLSLFSRLFALAD